MDKEDIQKVWAAYQKVQEAAKKKKLDPVGKADADIDNDGDVDSSDEYLHKRRKAIGKAMKKEEVDLGEEIHRDVIKAYKNSRDAEHKDGEYGTTATKRAVTRTANTLSKKINQHHPDLDMQGKIKLRTQLQNMKEKVEHDPNKANKEMMKDKFTASDKKIVDGHGGIDPKTPEVDGMKAADQTAASIKASEPGETHKNREADKTQGDKAIIQSPTSVKEAKTFVELMKAFMEK